MSEASHDLVLLDIHEVRARVSLGTTTIYKMMAAGAFPASVSLAPRTVRWLKSEIDAWITEKAAARRPNAALAAQDRQVA
jgi:prophage regulatory protein